MTRLAIITTKETNLFWEMGQIHKKQPRMETSAPKLADTGVLENIQASKSNASNEIVLNLHMVLVGARKSTRGAKLCSMVTMIILTVI